MLISWHYVSFLHHYHFLWIEHWCYEWWRSILDSPVLLRVKTVGDSGFMNDRIALISHWFEFVYTRLTFVFTHLNSSLVCLWFVFTRLHWSLIRLHWSCPSSVILVITLFSDSIWDLLSDKKSWVGLNCIEYQEKAFLKGLKKQLYRNSYEKYSLKTNKTNRISETYLEPS